MGNKTEKPSIAIYRISGPPLSRENFDEPVENPFRFGRWVPRGYDRDLEECTITLFSGEARKPTLVDSVLHGNNVTSSTEHQRQSIAGQLLSLCLLLRPERQNHSFDKSVVIRKISLFQTLVRKKVNWSFFY